MKKIIFLLAFILLAQFGYSQVAKKIIVEHFTNTRCSVCASRNPGFYTNYNAQTGVIHLAIHPSSPYSNCLFSMHNPADNDARTNYYGIFGGTPRLVIQGSVISAGANYGSASIFTPFLDQTSPAGIRIVQTKYGNDSISSRIVIKTEASNSLPGLSLFVALAEDTINYTGSNGEPVHYDVFRKSLSSSNGLNVTLPATVGDSVVYTFSSTVSGAWNFSRIFTLAILQETGSKAVVQAEAVRANSSSITTGLSNKDIENDNISALVTENGILVNQQNFIENSSIAILDVTGKTMYSKTLLSSVELVHLPKISTGIYIYTIKSSDSILKTGKLFIR